MMKFKSEWVINLIEGMKYIEEYLELYKKVTDESFKMELCEDLKNISNELLVSCKEIETYKIENSKVLLEGKIWKLEEMHYNELIRIFKEVFENEHYTDYIDKIDYKNDDVKMVYVRNAIAVVLRDIAPVIKYYTLRAYKEMTDEERCKLTKIVK